EPGVPGLIAVDLERKTETPNGPRQENCGEPAEDPSRSLRFSNASGEVLPHFILLAASSPWRACHRKWPYPQADMLGEGTLSQRPQPPPPLGEGAGVGGLWDASKQIYPPRAARQD